jgi:hypothetical protein
MKARQARVPKPPASRRRGTSAAGRDLQTSTTTGSNAGDGAARDVHAHAWTIGLGEGLHVLVVGPIRTSDNGSGPGFRATHVSPAPADGARATLLSSGSADKGWFGAGGGTVAVQAPPGGASILVTAYGVADRAALPQVKVLNLADILRLEEERSKANEAASHSREITSELTLHIERLGDRRATARGWVGNPAQRLRVEGFAIRPLETLAPSDVEYMGFGPRGQQTPWVTDGKLCGTRGRGLPLTGFAVRLIPSLRERFEVIYEGYFFDSGATRPARDGEPCLPGNADDPLGAVRLQIIERTGA